MAGHPPLAIDFGHVPPGSIVYDIVTPRWRRRCFSEARAARLPTIDGLAMLIGQAAVAFEKFFGRPPPRERRCRAARVVDVMSRPLVLGLTGSIGMGKSTVAAMFETLGVPVFDADARSAAAAGPGGSLVAAIEAAFPGSDRRAGIDRAKLGARVLGDPAALAPARGDRPPGCARGARKPSCWRTRDAPLVVFDIPLLFEIGGTERSRPGRGRVRSGRGATRARAGPARHEPKTIRAQSSRCRCPTPKSARAPIIVIETGRPRGNRSAQVAALVDAAAPGPLPAARRRPIIAAMREIVFDTETTGLDPRTGDRMVEIGCIELVNRVPTGPHLPRLFQPRPADADGGRGRSTGCTMRSWPTSRASTKACRS